MTDYQNELVMEHLDLVNWVIRTRISVPNRPLLTYDDFYAIGCEAICRAALKYQADSGEFAPFACAFLFGIDKWASTGRITWPGVGRLESGNTNADG